MKKRILAGVLGLTLLAGIVTLAGGARPGRGPGFPSLPHGGVLGGF